MYFLTVLFTSSQGSASFVYRNSLLNVTCTKSIGKSAKQMKFKRGQIGGVWWSVNNLPIDFLNNCFGEFGWVASGLPCSRKIWTFFLTTSARTRSYWQWLLFFSSNFHWIIPCPAKHATFSSKGEKKLSCFLNFLKLIFCHIDICRND